MITRRLIGTAAVFTAASALLAVSAPVSHAQATPSIRFDGDWAIDTTHTSANFSVRHMLVSQVRGRFNKFSGAIHANGKDFSKSTVLFTIQAASIDTNEPQRDGHLKSADFFDVAKYPEITYKSTSITKLSGNKYVAHGVFTLHGVSKPVDLPFTLSGPLKDAFGQVRFGLQSILRINRQDYGVKWNQKMDTGGWAVSNEVDIELNLEANPVGK